MKTLLFFALLVPAQVELHTPDCDATHCHLTLAQMDGVIRFQQSAMKVLRAQQEEIDRLQRSIPACRPV